MRFLHLTSPLGGQYPGALSTSQAHKGGVQRPTTPADGLQTFRQMTAARLSTTAQEALIALCARLETVENAPVLGAMMAPGRDHLRPLVPALPAVWPS
jgi:hypothetical protein